MGIRLIGILLIFSSNVGVAQTDASIIASHCYGVRKLDKAYRIQSIPEKISLAELDSTINEDSLKKKSLDNELLFYFPNINLFYEGYANLLQIGFTSRKIKHIHLECDGCDSIFPQTKKQSKDWIIKVARTDKVTIRAIGKNGNVLTQSSFPVFPIPAPIVYLDDCMAQEILKSIPAKLNLKLDKSVPLNLGFAILSWKIKIEDKEFKGSGSNVSQEVREYIQAKKSGTLILTIDYADPNGRNSIKEIFEFTLD